MNWTEFRDLPNDEKAQIMKREVLQGDSNPSQEVIKERMKDFAQGLGLQNPNLLYRMGYTLGVIEKSAEAIERNERNKEYRRSRKLRNAQAEAPEAAPVSVSEQEARIAALEQAVRDINDQLKLLRRTLILS